MTFRVKIWVAMAVAAIVPLALLGLLSYSTGRRELGETVGRLQAQNAREVARECERLVADAVSNLQLSVSYIPFGALDADELGRVLVIPYRQLPYVNAVVLLDRKGEAVAPPIHEEHPESHPELAGHEPVGEVELDLFASHIPHEAALKSGAAVGPPYRVPGRGPRVAVAVRIDGDKGWALAAEVSLSEMAARMAELSRADSTAYLVDGSGALLAHGQGEKATLGPSERALVSDGLSARVGMVRTLSREDGEWLAAFEPVQRLGWGMVVARRGAEAFRAANRVRDLTLIWGGLALVLTLGLGAVLARGLTRPVRALSAVARAATGGVYEPAAGIDGKDEIGEFGRAFNHMIEQIKRRDAEIRGWNQQLQQRVDQRTAELKEAQDQILRTRRLTALGSLSAGVAHEVNNPLTSIIGMLTLLKRDLPETGTQAQSVLVALDQAKRVTRIVNDLRQLAANEQQTGKRFAPGGAAMAALDGCAEQLKSARVKWITEVAPDVPEVLGDPLQIQQLVTHLVQNAIAAMPDGGSLRLSVKAVEGEAVKLTVTDTGKGIPAALRERIFDPFFGTKDQPARMGMGLSICHAIAEAHHGKITVESAEGQGTTFTLLLPAAPPQAHIY